MIREDIIEVLQACLTCLDGGKKEDYPQFNPGLWGMGEKLCAYLKPLEVIA